MADASEAAGDHAGTLYTTVLAQIHGHLQPKSYFEIGTLNGATLALASCPSVAVDPEFRIASNVLGKKRACHFFQMKSDDFFAEHSPTAILGRKIDFAFLDGMHYFEFLLRDFANTERHCAANSVIVMHDCVPTEAHVGRRNSGDNTHREGARHPEWWAGDVWKTALALKRFRPDLTIDVFDAPPTGLVVVTNLDPDSTSLREDYPRIVSELRDGDLAAYGVSRLHEELAVTSTDRFKDFSSITRHYWL